MKFEFFHLFPDLLYNLSSFSLVSRNHGGCFGCQSHLETKRLTFQGELQPLRRSRLGSGKGVPWPGAGSLLRRTLFFHQTYFFFDISGNYICNILQHQFQKIINFFLMFFEHQLFFSGNEM